jgi:hypothetical protein
MSVSRLSTRYWFGAFVSDGVSARGWAGPTSPIGALASSSILDAFSTPSAFPIEVQFEQSNTLRQEAAESAAFLVVQIDHAIRKKGFTGMLTEDSARNLAAHWVQAWNSHDLAEIMSHYAEGAVLVSPVAARILNDPMGMVKGKEDLRAYFKKGLEVYPNLKFDLLDILWGLSSIVLYYVNQKGTKTGEFMELDASGKVVRVVANYNG